MKLNIVPAKTGAVWVRLGIRAFARQPLAMTGLLFMMMTMMSLASVIPVIGGALALVLLPAATLGLMAATREADAGKFPMPTVLVSAFRAGRQRLRAMLVLGALYAAGFIAVLAISALFDGGQIARVYLFGAELTREQMQADDFQLATWVAMGLYLPLSLTFWHAPALVHWHGLAPLQSMFYSFVACLRNFWSYTVFGVVWLAVFMGVGMLVSIVGMLLGLSQSVVVVMMPAALVLAAMFFSSLYFTFRDTFSTEDGRPAGEEPLPGG